MCTVAQTPAAPGAVPGARLGWLLQPAGPIGATLTQIQGRDGRVQHGRTGKPHPAPWSPLRVGQGLHPHRAPLHTWCRPMSRPPAPEKSEATFMALFEAVRAPQTVTCQTQKRSPDRQAAQEALEAPDWTTLVPMMASCSPSRLCRHCTALAVHRSATCSRREAVSLAVATPRSGARVWGCGRA